MTKQHTYAMIKPGYEDLWDTVLQRIADEGLEVAHKKEMQFDDKTAAAFYAEHVGKSFYPELAGYMTSGKILALDLAGENAVAKWREIIGPTKKEVAVEQAPNSLRALYARSTTENLVHGSDSTTSAIRELGIIFGEEIANSAKSEIEKVANEVKEKVEQAKEEGNQTNSKCCLLL